MSCQRDSTLEIRFWKKVDRNGPVPRHRQELGPCWEWTAYKDEHGRGQIWTKSGLRHAHKVAWELINGPVPEGMCLLHQCDNSGCVNTAHMRLGNQAENIKEIIARKRMPTGDRHWTKAGARSARPVLRDPDRTLEQRFWDMVDKNGPVPEHRRELGNCWMWTGSKNQCGYGLFGVGGTGNIRVAHKIHWIMIAERDLPPKMKLLHKCDTPSCVRLDHLFVGSHADNVRDMMEKGRNAQPYGEQHYKSKLTFDDVCEIRRLWREENIPIKQLAIRFQRKPNTVSKIVHRKRWL